MADLPAIPGGEDLSVRSEDPVVLQKLVHIRETQLAGYVDTVAVLEAETTELHARVDGEFRGRVTAEAKLAAAEEQQTATQARVDQLDGRIVELEDALAKTRSEYESRLSDVIREAVSREQSEHLEELRTLADQRAKLQQTVDSLTAQIGEAAETRSATPATIAGGFVDTMAQVAARELADQRFDVSMSRLEVEARGVFRAPADGEPAQLVTRLPGQVDAGELSTMRMEFRLSPKPPGAVNVRDGGPGGVTPDPDP